MSNSRAMRAYGSIFDNKKKTTENQPDYLGSFGFTKDMLRRMLEEPLNEHGVVEVRYSGWKRTSPRGVQYISGNIQGDNFVQSKTKQSTQPARKPQQETMFGDDDVTNSLPDEEIPF